MNDLVLEILLTERQFTVAALAGNAGAGGCFLALAADHVWARNGVLLNPHYKSMGNLYGSEYWTYLLPRRVAPEAARTLMHDRLPVSAAQAAALGLVDAALRRRPRPFRAEVAARAQALAADPGFEPALQARSTPARRRRSRQATGRLPRRGTGAHEAQLLRLRPQLPRRAPRLRGQGAALAHAAVAGKAQGAKTKAPLSGACLPHQTKARGALRPADAVDPALPGPSVAPLRGGAEGVRGWFNYRGVILKLPSFATSISLFRNAAL